MKPIKVITQVPRYTRFTREDDATIEHDFLTYIPMLEIAHKLGRSEGVIRQRIYHLKLRRNPLVSKILAWAPEHLRNRLFAGELIAENFINDSFAWRENQRSEIVKQADAEKEAWLTKTRAQCAEIDCDYNLTRNNKLVAKRMIGMTLEEIGSQHGITRERVRQLTDPNYRPTKVSGDKLERIERRRAKLLNEEVEALVESFTKAAPEAKQRFLFSIKQRKVRKETEL